MNNNEDHVAQALGQLTLFDIGWDPSIVEAIQREKSWPKWTFRHLCAALHDTAHLPRSDPRRRKAVDNAKKFLDSGDWNLL